MPTPSRAGGRGVGRPGWHVGGLRLAAGPARRPPAAARSGQDSVHYSVRHAAELRERASGGVAGRPPAPSADARAARGWSSGSAVRFKRSARLRHRWTQPLSVGTVALSCACAAPFAARASPRWAIRSMRAATGIRTTPLLRIDPGVAVQDLVLGRAHVLVGRSTGVGLQARFGRQPLRVHGQPGRAAGLDRLPPANSRRRTRSAKSVTIPAQQRPIPSLPSPRGR